MGPLIPLFWTSGDICLGFQSQNGQPYSYLAEAYIETFNRLVILNVVTIHWIEFSDRHFVKMSIQACNFLCKRQRCYHRAGRRKQLTDRILK